MSNVLMLGQCVSVLAQCVTSVCRLSVLSKCVPSLFSFSDIDQHLDDNL